MYPAFHVIIVREVGVRFGGLCVLWRLWRWWCDVFVVVSLYGACAFY